LQHISRGYYVDIGANDPAIDSVTRWFYDQGWSGINIEPVTHWYGKLQADRSRDTNLQLAVSSRPGPTVLYDIPETGLATLDRTIAETHRQGGCHVEEVTVTVQTLDAVLHQHASGREIHFLKVDVEGAEREVLESASFSSVRPWIVLVEATAPRSPKVNHQLWEDLLTTRGYQFAYFDGLNRFYVAQEHPELHAAFQAPPNTFDGFMRHTEWQARSDNHHLRQQLAVASQGQPDGDTTLAPLRQRLEQQEQQLQAWRQRAQAMERSTSWRLTAPLRALKRTSLGAAAPASPTLPAPQTPSAPADTPLIVPAPAPAATVDADGLLLHQITMHWRLVDQLHNHQPPVPTLSCALCGHTAQRQHFRPFETQCAFGGGRLLRHQCPKCDVIFGPAKMLELNAAELSAEYDWHYRIFSE
ncbi:MAG: FkbM family methyltransferase, partial [Giesbergeria sp.]